MKKEIVAVVVLTLLLSIATNTGVVAKPVPDRRSLPSMGIPTKPPPPPPLTSDVSFSMNVCQNLNHVQNGGDLGFDTICFTNFRDTSSDSGFVSGTIINYSTIDIPDNLGLIVREIAGYGTFSEYLPNIDSCLVTTGFDNHGMGIKGQGFSFGHDMPFMDTEGSPAGSDDTRLIIDPNDTFQESDEANNVVRCTRFKRASSVSQSCLHPEGKSYQGICYYWTIE